MTPTKVYEEKIEAQPIRVDRTGGGVSVFFIDPTGETTLTTKERLEADLGKAKKKLQQLEKWLALEPRFNLDNGSISVKMKEMALAHKGMVLIEIEELQAALARVREGSYGHCERCGRSINPERLEALPIATLCTACAQATQTFPG